MLNPPRYVLLLALLHLACASAAPRMDWTLLGERTVDHRAERDEIAVGAHTGPFEQIRLSVHHRAVTLHDVRVHYANGTVQDVPIRHRILVGGQTRAIDLAGQDRRIERVSLVYETSGRRDPRDPRAVVRLYGRR